MSVNIRFSHTTAPRNSLAQCGQGGADPYCRSTELPCTMYRHHLDKGLFVWRIANLQKCASIEFFQKLSSTLRHL